MTLAFNTLRLLLLLLLLLFYCLNVLRYNHICCVTCMGLREPLVDPLYIGSSQFIMVHHTNIIKLIVIEILVRYFASGINQTIRDELD